MNENDDRQSEGPPSPPTPPARPYLPPRLRQRLEDAEAEPIKVSPAGAIAGWAIMIALIGAVVGGIMLIRHNEAMKAKAAADQAEKERLAAVADSIARVKTADSLRVVAVLDSTKAFQALPRWKQEVLLAKAHPDSSSTAITDEEGHFAIDGGTYLFDDAANQAADAAKTATKMAVRMVPVDDNGNTTYHVYVGSFSHKAEAAFVANTLLQKGALPQAKVVKLEK
jgi:hypothetical protein